jgi:hypothetical protein
MTEVQELLRELAEAGEALAEEHRRQAKTLRKAYEFYVAQGFSEEQAFCILLAQQEQSWKNAALPNRAARRAAGKRGRS